MSKVRSSRVEQAPLAARCGGVRDRTLLAMVLYTLVSAGEALAADQFSMSDFGPRSAGANQRPVPRSFDVLATPQLDAFGALPGLDEKAFSPDEFRARRRTVFDADPAVTRLLGEPLMNKTTVWQRLSDYRSRDRVRVLTLWESRASSVSLQAGKRGDPSLQWTSSWINRGDAKRGVFDRLLAVSLISAGNSLSGRGHSSTPSQTSRQASVPMVTGPK